MRGGVLSDKPPRTARRAYPRKRTFSQTRVKRRILMLQRSKVKRYWQRGEAVRVTNDPAIKLENEFLRSVVVLYLSIRGRWRVWGYRNDLCFDPLSRHHRGMTSNYFKNRPYTRDQGPLYQQPSHQNKRLVSIPENAIAHVRLFFGLMRDQGRIYDDICEASGCLRATLKSWRHRSIPSLSSLEAVFGALGWNFVPVPAIETLRPDIAADLASLASKMQASLPDVFNALLDVAMRQREQREHAAGRLAEIDAEREARRAANDNKRRRKPKTETPAGANDNSPRRKRETAA